jgi:Tfp pilus assembly protein PilF
MQVRPRWLDTSGVEELRSLAGADARAQRDLGLRLMLEDGDAAAGRDALTLAANRDPADPLTWLALAVHYSEHGHADTAFVNLGRAVGAAVDERLRPDWCVAPGLEPRPTPEDCRALAGAIAEAAARLIRETDHADRTELVSQILERHEALLSFATAHSLRRTLEWDARLAGDGQTARRELESQGALLRWRVAGPFGPFPSQSFDVVSQPERDDHLAGSYDLGPGRGVQPTMDPELSASSVQLQSPINEAGTWYAEAAVRARVSGPVDVRLWSSSDAAVAVFVGGERVILRDGRSGYAPEVTLATVILEAGQPVRVLVKLGSEDGGPAFNLSMRDAEGRVLEQLDPESGGWAGSARRVEREDLLDLLAPAPGEPVSGVRAFVVSLLARARARWELADEVLNRVAEPSPLVLLLRASAAASTPAMPRSIREDRMLSDMRAVFAADPECWRARLVLARQLISEDQGREALDLLRQGIELNGEVAPLWHDLGAVARRMGSQSMAAEAFEAALRVDERSCESLEQLAQMYDDAGLTRQRDEALERLVRCNAISNTRAEMLSRGYRPADALAEVRRLQGVDEYPERYEPDLVDLELAVGDRDGAARRLETLRGRWPRSGAFVSALADIAGSGGGLEAVVSRLAPEIERYPWELGALRRMAAVAGAARETQAWRVDGLEHIRRFEAEQVEYDSPSVFILDRAVYRVYPDLSSLELVHQVMRVLAQEAVDGASEFQAPRGSEVLTLRTIKADGTILEPLEFDPEGTSNLAGVEVGDSVEWEYIITRGPSRVFPGGLQTPRFYFATPDTAMHLSELIVLVPDGVEVDFVPRGPSPPQPQPVRLGSLSGFRFAAERVRSQVREPAMPSMNEVFSSVGAVAREDSRSLVRSWSDGLLAAQRADWRMRDLVRELRRPGQTEVDLARALYDHVLEHVRPGQGGTPASFTLASGQGDIMLLYSALLRIAGFRPEIVYTWSLSDDRSGPYLEPGELDSALLRVTLDDEERWIVIGSRHAPFGHVPALVRGQPGLTACFDAREVVVPERSPVDDVVETRIDGQVVADGTLDFRMTGRFLGARATDVRSRVSRIPEAERALRAAELLGQQFSGGVATDAEFAGVDDRHAPLELRAAIQARMLGRREGNDLLLPARLGEGMRYSALAQLSERRTALAFDEELHEVVEQRLRLPPGASVAELCPQAHRELGAASFTVSCTHEGDVLVHRAEITLPPQRIAPADYGAFSEFLRLYDEAVATESRVRLP